MKLEHHIFKRFDVNNELVKERKNSFYSRRVGIWAEKVQLFFHTGNYRNLVDMDGLQKLFTQSYLLQYPKETIMRHLYTFPESGMLDIYSQLHAGKIMTATLQGKTCEVVADSEHGLMFRDWLDMFCVSLILRDHFSHLSTLISVPDSIISKPNSSGVTNGFNLALADLCKGMFNPYADMRKLRDSVLTASAHYYVSCDEQKEYVNHLYLPLVELIYVIHSEEREKHYQKALLQALQAHKAYYDNDEEANATDAIISLCITGIAAYAYDKFGLVPEVETDYMPMWLVKGEFPSYEEAFPELKDLPKPIRTDFQFTAKNLPQTEPESTRIYEAALKWAKEEQELPPLCDVIGRDIESKKVNKKLVGEIFVDVLGEDAVLTLYSMEPSLIQAPEAWLEMMKTCWHGFITQFSQEAITDVQFVDCN